MGFLFVCATSEERFFSLGNFFISVRQRSRFVTSVGQGLIDFYIRIAATTPSTTGIKHCRFTVYHEGIIVPSRVIQRAHSCYLQCCIVFGNVINILLFNIGNQCIKNTQDFGASVTLCQQRKNHRLRHNNKERERVCVRMVSVFIEAHLIPLEY